jgi:hypothetical protein
MRKMTPIHHLCLRLATVPLAVFCAASAPLHSGEGKKLQLPASSVHQVVKNLAWNELQASEHPAHYYRYVERDISPDGSETADQIATPHGTVGRLLEVDNHPPSHQQIQKNQQLLARLPGDVQLQQSRYKDQRSNTLRRDNVIKDIPNAFIYTDVGRDSLGRIMLKFRPSPDFQPSSRQSLILEGMAGELWIDPATQRMVKIDGSLIHDVKIGWGFLARLNKGGTFLMEQSKGPDGTWHQKLLSVHFDGTVLIFKHLHIHETQIRCCFEQVPDNLSIGEAVHLLQANTSLPSDWQSRLDAIQHPAASH